jgi:hypothetical protein
MNQNKEGLFLRKIIMTSLVIVLIFSNVSLVGGFGTVFDFKFEESSDHSIENYIRMHNEILEKNVYEYTFQYKKMDLDEEIVGENGETPLDLHIMALQSVLTSNPRVFGQLDFRWSIRKRHTVFIGVKRLYDTLLTFRLVMHDSPDNIRRKKFEVEKKAKEIVLDTIKEGMTDREKILALHDYVSKNTRYSLLRYLDLEEFGAYTTHSAYGSLVDGSAYCGGYAKGFKWLLDEVNIPNLIVTGNANGESHMWNLVFFEGKWRYIDVTFNNPLIGDIDKGEVFRPTFFALRINPITSIHTNQTLVYDYFDISEEELRKTHDFEFNIEEEIVLQNFHKTSINKLANEKINKEMNDLFRGFTRNPNNFKENLERLKLNALRSRNGEEFERTVEEIEETIEVMREIHKAALRLAGLTEEQRVQIRNRLEILES